MLILENGQTQISWGDNSHINDHKINSGIYLNDYYINIITAKDFSKNLKTMNVFWFFVKSENKKY